MRRDYNAQGTEPVISTACGEELPRPYTWELVAAALLLVAVYVGGLYYLVNDCSYEEVCDVD